MTDKTINTLALIKHILYYNAHKNMQAWYILFVNYWPLTNDVYTLKEEIVCRFYSCCLCGQWFITQKKNLAHLHLFAHINRKIRQIHVKNT